MAAAAGAGAFLATSAPQVAAAILGSGKSVLWLRGAGCGGCTASFLNGGNPDVLSALDSISLNLVYHDGLMAQQGISIDGLAANTSKYNAVTRRSELIDEGNYILVVEGAIPNGPDGTGKYCMIGGKTLKEIFSEAAEKADNIVALGTCAAYGGISAADRSVTDARGVAYTGASRLKGIMSELNMRKKVINVPGCPTHPDWLLLTLADLVSDVEIELDDYRRPVAFFRRASVHDSCPRRGAYDRGQRDRDFAGDGCLYDLGCKGMVTFADCPTRRWNGGVSMCTQAGGLCVACVEPEFPDGFMPFNEKIEDRSLISGINVDLGAKIILGGAVLGAGIHAVKRLAIGENERDDELQPSKRQRKGL